MTTLEMGVDIGDLSSLILCSMPPSKASFIQRVGRSGRKNGNAFNVVVANAKPHDLYFFTEPEEMLHGQLDTPDIYLKAQAVLERQLTAYCLDCWAKEGAKQQDIPRYVSGILNHLENGGKDKFPFNFFHFIQQNRESLWTGFTALFSKSMDKASAEHFKDYIEEKLTGKILGELNQLHKQVSSIRSKIKSLTNKHNQLAQQFLTEDVKKEIKEIDMEKGGLSQLTKSLASERDTYNFLTDTGLLPNYAFPEAGVTLNTVILKEKKSSNEEEGFYPKSIKFTYERPSSAAIAKMAPDNYFYALGRK